MTYRKSDDGVDAPYARKIAREKDKAGKKAKAENHQEELIDEAVEESFPASDPATPKRIT